MEVGLDWQNAFNTTNIGTAPASSISNIQLSVWTSSNDPATDDQKFAVSLIQKASSNPADMTVNELTSTVGLHDPKNFNVKPNGGQFTESAVFWIYRKRLKTERR